jgi:hypothetical protein
MRALVLAAALVFGAAPAHADEPSDGELVAGGLGLAIPTYFVGVVLHEGSHAVAAELVGADVTQLRLWPGKNPSNGHFQFGWTRVKGLPRGRGTRIFFLSAPKITDLLLLGGYSTLYATDSLPRGSEWGHLVIQVLATGLWVDFVKDVFVFHDGNDMVRIYDHLGLDNEWKRLPARVLHLAASVGLGYVIWRGYEELFAKNNDPAAVPAFSLTTRW